MTAQKHLKALVRARMARTGESYTAARRHVARTATPPGLSLLATFRAHDRHCMTAVFTPDDRHVVSGGFGGQARIWTVDGQPTGQLAGHESSVNVVRISPDGATALTASSDKTVRVWDFPERRERAILGRHRRQVLALDLDAPGDLVWSGGHDGSLQSWVLSTGTAAARLALGASVTSVAIRASDGLVAAGTVGGGIVVVDRSGTGVARLDPDARAIGSLSWAADGTFLVASTPDGVGVWAADGWERVRSLGGIAGSIVPVALSPDGDRIAVGWDHHVGLWSADDSQPEVTVDGLPKGVYGLCFSHDGRLLAVAAADGRVRVWTVS